MFDFYNLEIVGLVSPSACRFKCKNSHMYGKSTISTFKGTQRTTQGQRKILYKKNLTVLVLLIHGYGASWKHFQTYFMYVHCLLLCASNRQDRGVSSLEEGRSQICGSCNLYSTQQGGVFYGRGVSLPDGLPLPACPRAPHAQQSIHN